MALAAFGLPSGGARPASSTLAASVLSTGTLVKGVDVSSYQHPGGKAISWAKVHAAGYKFAMIKSTEGSYYVNPYYAGDAKAAVTAGMYVAAYHFANPRNSGGAAQAKYAVTKTSYKIGGRYLPLVLDIEYDPTAATNATGCRHQRWCRGLPRSWPRRRL